jgi:hypothetical protein
MLIAAIATLGLIALLLAALGSYFYFALRGPYGVNRYALPDRDRPLYPIDRTFRHRG